MMTRAAELEFAAGGIGIAVPRLGLYTNDYTPVVGSVFADFTQATYTGYTVVTPTLGAVFVSQPDNKVSSPVSQAVFTGATAGTPQDVHGWFLFDNVSHVIYAAARLPDGPFAMTTVLDRLAIDVELKLVGSESADVQS